MGSACHFFDYWQRCFNALLFGGAQTRRGRSLFAARPSASLKRSRLPRSRLVRRSLGEGGSPSKGSPFGLRTFPCIADIRGVALIEFALVAPVILVLLFGAIEVSRYILISQKIEKAGFVLGDIASQYRWADIAAANIGPTFDQLNTILNPYGTAAKEVAVISLVTKQADGVIRINWQKVGGGTLSNADTVSIVSSRNASAITASVNGMPTTFTGDVATQLATMPVGEAMLVCEVFFAYQPIVDQLLVGISKNDFKIASRTLVRRTFFRPREGTPTPPPPPSTSSGGNTCAFGQCHYQGTCGDFCLDAGSYVIDPGVCGTQSCLPGGLLQFTPTGPPQGPSICPIVCEIG